MSGPLLLLSIISMAGLLWAIVALGRGNGDPERSGHWRVASVIALVFLVALTGGIAVGQTLFK